MPHLELEPPSENESECVNSNSLKRMRSQYCQHQPRSPSHIKRTKPRRASQGSPFISRSQPHDAPSRIGTLRVDTSVLDMNISIRSQQDPTEVAFWRSVDNMFVGRNPPPNEKPNPNEKKGPKGVPRLSHKKSRTGCQRCRARRVKVTYPPPP
jgi:hypothetical protein